MESISVPTDFSQTTVPSLSDLDTVVRCQVCKDYFNTPMITSCAHTFCSLCIRQCLSADGKCPTCRAGDQPSKLRRNGAVEEIVAAWINVRADVLEAVQPEEDDSVEETGRRKRKFVAEDDVLETPRKNRRQTRSLVRQTSGIAAGSQIIDLDDSADGADGDYHPENEGRFVGLVACPVCNKRMKEAAVFAHLDSCMLKTSPPTPRAHGGASSQLATKFPSETPQYLGFLNYAMLKDLQLRKKLKDQGIPNDGSRQILEKRYTYWINLYNSNCDAKSPRNKRELLRELAIWEKSQFGHSAGSDRDAVMAKDFDGDGWKGRHKDQFQDLIEQARAKAKLVVRVADVGNAARGDYAETNECAGTAVDLDDVPSPPQPNPPEETGDVHPAPSRDDREIPDSDDELYRGRTPPPADPMIKTPSKQEMTMPVFRVQEDA